MIRIVHISDTTTEVFIRVYDAETKRNFKIVLSVGKLKNHLDQAARNKTATCREAGGAMVITHVGETTP